MHGWLVRVLRLLCLLVAGLALAPACRAAPGLLGTYFNNLTLDGAPALVRVDSTVNFDWGGGSPGSGVGVDIFSVRWTGYVRVQTTGTYYFQTLSDDGVRLYVNGSLLIDNWTVHGPTYDTSLGIALTAGVDYPITLEFYENYGGAVMALSWRKPGDAGYSVVPASNGSLGLSTLGPGGLPGAKWWGRSTSLALADGASISTWANEGNASNNLTAGATKPVFRNNNAQNINFNPVVEFTATTASDAAAQYFQASSLMGSSNYNAMYAALVGYPTSTNQANGVFFEAMAAVSADNADGRFNFHWPWGGTELDWDAGSCCSLNRIQLFSSTIVNTPSVFMLTRDAASATTQAIRQNGSVLGSTTAARATATGNNSMFRLGFSSATGWNPFRGLIAEGAVFAGTSLTSTQISQLESYLGIKYGSTLGGAGATTTSLVDSGGNTVWGANTGFHYNLTVVGRDDTSGLDQRISRSTNAGSQITVSTSTSASLPSGASTVSAQAGTAFSADLSFVAVGDNNGTASSTANIASGTLAGYLRSARAWRVQTSGTAPTQFTLCVPDSMLPASLTTGTVLGVLATDSAFAGVTVTATVSAGTCPGSGVGVSSSVSGRVVQFSAAALGASGTVRYFTLAKLVIDHLNITASSATGLTCSATTFTITACADAACSSNYTGGLTGNLALSGTSMTVNYPSGAGFTMASGVGTATVSAQVTTVGAVTVSASGLSVTPGNAQPVFCGLGVAAAQANSCSFTAADAGLVFNMPNALAETTVPFTVQAVKKSDNSLACTPAFASVAKNITFKCSYTNPSTGTLPVRIGGVALNAGNSTAAACDPGGKAVSLSFDGTGTAATVGIYADVGQVLLTATYSGSGSDAGLTMSGTDSVVVAPFDFGVGGISSSTIGAGSPFSATVTARNFLGAATPNFGKETSPEGVTLGFVRAGPTGTGAVSGGFSGSVGGFASGVATASNLVYSEVGKIDVVATLSSGSYLGSGLAPAGSSHGAMVWCSWENGTCTLPSGTANTVYYYSVTYKAGFIQTGKSGSVACTNVVFGDPHFGVGKGCYYVTTSGVNAGNTGAARLTPHRFVTSVAPACAVGGFSYAGQPFGATVTAKNLAGTTTVNYDGSASTSPNFAKAVTLSEATALGVGSLSGTSIAAGAFSAGVASTTSPTYTYTSKLTGTRTLTVRASDTDSVSSAGYTEGATSLLSGRLRLANATGSASAALQVPVMAEYWSGNAWVLNSADSCTTLAAANVATSNPRTSLGAVSTAATSVGALSLVAGQGKLTFAAPSPAGSSVSYDVTANLGSTSADQSCNVNHPSSTGAAKPWLRSSFGSCSALWDRDPAARISFGVYAPESRKTVHVRDLY